MLGDAVVRALHLRVEDAGSIPAAALSSATFNKLFCPAPLVLEPYNTI